MKPRPVSGGYRKEDIEGKMEQPQASFITTYTSTHKAITDIMMKYWL